MPIPPSLYSALKARERDPHGRRGGRGATRDSAEHVRRVWQENREVYGVRKVWQQLKREGQAVARCTVARAANASNTSPESTAVSQGERPDVDTPGLSDTTEQ